MADMNQSQIRPISGAIITENQTQCANCHSREIRKISKNRYFCPACCTEFAVFGKRVTIYTITDDGVLKKIG